MKLAASSTFLALALAMGVSFTWAFVPNGNVLPNQRPVVLSSTTTMPDGDKGSDDDGDEFYIDEERRALLNLILVSSAAVTVGGIAIPYLAFFVPPSPPGGSGGAVLAKDAIGNDIVAANYLASKPAGDRSLVQGLRGDATYLIVKDEEEMGGGLESYALNAICTHLGCVVPWNAAANKFMCPCHGSQYSPDGTVIRGPAPLPLELEHVSTDNADGKIKLLPWTEDDFRTGEKAWWN